MNAWAAIAWLWLLFAALSLLSGLGMVALCWALGARPRVVRFHIGPTLLSFRLLGVRWCLGPLPLGTGVAFTQEGEPEDPADPNPYLQLSFPRRLLVISGSVLGLLLIAGVCLSPGQALASVLSGFGQLVNVFQAPERVHAFLALRPEGFRLSLGVLAAKMAALNLLPIPPLAGYVLLREAVRKLRSRPPEDSSALPIWGFVLLLVLWGAWGWGVYKGLRAQSAKAPVPEAIVRDRAGTE
jgi:membrane-associated protease RseP (regulator of RpoE activity)